MLDIILIQHVDTGLKLLDYQQEHTQFKVEHADIFSGFLTAIQNITSELNIGTVILISTKGERGHNCIIITKYPISIIILVDQEDPIDFWREQGQLMADKFLEQYGNSFDPHDITKFQEFNDIIKQMCGLHEYCD